MPVTASHAGRLSLSVDLPPLADENGTPGLSEREFAAGLTRLSAVSNRLRTPVTWVWEGKPPANSEQVTALSEVAGDLGWQIPESRESRQQYRARILIWLRQWRELSGSLRTPLRMVVTSAGKTSIPYDALTRAGIVVQRDGHLLSGDGSWSVPRWMHVGLWQLPLQAELRLSQGWLGATAAMWRLQGLLRQLVHSSEMHLHLRIAMDRKAPLGTLALGNWEKLLDCLAQHQAAGVRLQLAGDVCTELATRLQSPAASILRAA